MRFLHTADWQIGMKAAGLGPCAALVRAERLAGAQRVMLIAAQEQAEFIVLAGDTFEDNAVRRQLVRDVIGILAKAPCPVYILPGNHDPLCAGSVWDMAEWRSTPVIHLLDEEKPVPVFPGVTLYPCPIRERFGVDDPTAWISPDGDGIRIGVAHGSVEGLQMDDPQFPIPRDAPARRGLDYVALGHWHSFGEIADANGSRMAYSGTHEPTAFGERDSGNAVLVEIGKRGDAPVLRKIRSAGLQWRLLDEYVSRPGDLAALLEMVGKIPDPASALVRLKVRGVFTLDEIGMLETLRAMHERGRFFYFDLIEEALAPAPSGNDWLDAIPDPVVREAAYLIAGELGDSVGAAVRRQALLELYSIVRETAG